MWRLRVELTVAGVAVAAVLVADSTGLLSNRAAMVLDDSAQLAAGVLAAVCCGWMARRLFGVQRVWRALMAVGMAGWSAGQLIWSWYQVFAATPLPSPSWADFGYLTLPVFGIAALLTVAVEGSPGRNRPGRPGVARLRLVLCIDGLVVVGSLFILTWATALGAVVRAGAPSHAAFAVAIAYPVTDLLLVVMVVLLLATRPLPERLRPQLVLLGLGLVGLSVSDSIFAYLVSSGATSMPPIANAGFIAGPVLVALAALQHGEGGRDRALTTVDSGGRLHLLLPYAPLPATGALIVSQLAMGTGPGLVEMSVGMVVVLLVVVRQMLTLIDNQALIARVSEAQDKLVYQASHDPLTGLANRALFNSRLSDAVGRHRTGRDQLVLLFVDLDDFKAVNDTLGHVAGDRVLHLVAQRLLSCTGPQDTVARLGGDEFGVLLAGEADVQTVSTRVLSALRQPIQVDGRTIQVGVSLGAAVADTGDASVSPEALLRRADAAMYAGKRQGKGLLIRYGADTPDDADPELPTLLGEAMTGVTAQSVLDVRYQPIVRLADGARVAVEALACWSHPRLGAVPADVFVAVAERAGLIGALDDFVLDRACRDIAAYLDHHGWAPAVHVNISAGRLGNPEVEDVVRTALKRYSLEPSRLVLEVTESRRIPDLAAAVESVARLRKLGVRLALDDFGTGYNTLTQLHALPLDILKLDRALIEVAVTESRAQSLCRSVTSIAVGMGMEVIAEGVETGDQEAAVLQVGCGFGQGHRYGRPGPLAEAATASAG